MCGMVGMILTGDTQGEYLSSVLPSDKRRLTNVAFAALCECVEVAEASLVKICMYFDDEVLQTVVAIVRALISASTPSHICVACR